MKENPGILRLGGFLVWESGERELETNRIIPVIYVSLVNESKRAGNLECESTKSMTDSKMRKEAKRQSRNISKETTLSGF